MNNLVSIYLDQGRLDDSEKLGLQVLETARRELGDENCHTLDSIANLSSTYQKQEKAKEAEELQVGDVNPRKREWDDGDIENLEEVRKKQKN